MMLGIGFFGMLYKYKLENGNLSTTYFKTNPPERLTTN
jgi:hypothetical protein